MPDFPRTGGGATATEVWAYATRQLSADGANIIRDAVLSDATKIAGGNVDAAVSSRATQAQILSDATPFAGGNVDAAVTTRAPTGEYDTELDVVLSSRSPANEYDTELDAAISSRADAAEFTAVRAAKMDKIQDFVEEASGTLSATGSEDTIKEILTTVNKLHCFIDLTNMAASDSITVRQYMTIKTAGSPVKYAEESFSDAQSLPMLYVITKPARYGIKVTLEQTAGANRDYDWETFQEKAA